MTNPGWREISGDQSFHACPGHPSFLATSPKGLPPETVSVSEARRNTARPGTTAPGIGALLRAGFVQAPAQLSFDLPELGLPALAHRLPNQHEDISLPRLAKDVGEAEEVERLRLALSPAFPLLSRVAAELDQLGFLRVQCQAGARQTSPIRRVEGIEEPR